MSSLFTKYLRQTFCSLRPKLIVRNFTASGPVTKDIIRDLYIGELNSYKPTQVQAASETGQVKELKLPATPKPPKVDVDISSELAAYEDEELPPLEKEKTLITESLEQKLFAEEATHTH